MIGQLPVSTVASKTDGRDSSSPNLIGPEVVKLLADSPKCTKTSKSETSPDKCAACGIDPYARGGGGGRRRGRLPDAEQQRSFERLRRIGRRTRPTEPRKAGRNRPAAERSAPPEYVGPAESSGAAANASLGGVRYKLAAWLYWRRFAVSR